MRRGDTVTPPAFLVDGITVYQKWKSPGTETIDGRDSISVKPSYCHRRCFCGFSGDSMNETEVMFLALYTLEALRDTWLPTPRFMMTDSSETLRAAGVCCFGKAWSDLRDWLQPIGSPCSFGIAMCKTQLKYLSLHGVCSTSR